MKSNYCYRLCIWLTLSVFFSSISKADNQAFSKYGMNEHVFLDSNYQAVCDRLISAGVKWVRIDSSWSFIEPQKGVYGSTLVSRMDDAINRLSAGGVNVVLMLGYTAAWASSVPGVNASRYRAANMADWDNFVNYITARYNGKVKYWQVWNEQDGGFWFDNAQNFYTTLQVAANRIRSANSQNKVLLGGLTAPGGPFINSLLSLGAGAYFDVFCYHAYGDSRVHTTRYQDAIAMMTTYGIQNKKIWITETGFSTEGNVVLEKEKADYLDQVYAFYSRFPNIEVVMPFLFRNITTSTAKENNFGLVQNNMSPLPAVFYYTALNGAEVNYGLQDAYSALVPSTTALCYVRTATGDGQYVTSYSATAKRVLASKYMYFTINDNWLRDANGGVDSNVSIEVTYLDSGSAGWALNYDSVASAYSVVNAGRSNSGTWKTKIFQLSDGKFANRQNYSADFRLFAGTSDLIVSSVVVRKEVNYGRVVLKSSDAYKLMKYIVSTDSTKEAYNPVATMGGVECRKIEGNGKYSYFRVAQGLVGPWDSDVKIGITFWDSGADSLALHYQAEDNNYKIRYIPKTNTGAWRTVELVLNDALFTHLQNNSCDFRISNNGDGSSEYVSSVYVVRTASGLPQ